jgi:hypothetical protein
MVKYEEEKESRAHGRGGQLNGAAAPALADRGKKSHVEETLK